MTALQIWNLSRSWHLNINFWCPGERLWLQYCQSINSNVEPTYSVSQKAGYCTYMLQYVVSSVKLLRQNLQWGVGVHHHQFHQCWWSAELQTTADKSRMSLILDRIQKDCHILLNVIASIVGRPSLRINFWPLYVMFSRPSAKLYFPETLLWLLKLCDSLISPYWAHRKLEKHLCKVKESICFCVHLERAKRRIATDALCRSRIKQAAYVFRPCVTYEPCMKARRSFHLSSYL